MPDERAPRGRERGTVRGAVRVAEYDPANARHRAAFRDLNLAWIEEHFAVEPRDRRELDDPERWVLVDGGRILVAEADGAVLGVCALVRGHAPDVWELVKMAVAAEARGRGAGRALGEAAIATARAAGGRRLELLSNTRLGPAIALYRALGFVEEPLPPNEYARANIMMAMPL